MDIDKVSEHIRSTEFGGNGKVRRDNGFGQILDRAMDAPLPEEGPKEGCCPVTEAVSASPSEVCNADMRALKHASNVLDLLEEYAEALNNPKMSLKSIEPMVLRIQQELKGLDMRPIPHAGQHDELARLLNHIAVTARIEAFKFQRGDYIA